MKGKVATLLAGLAFFSAVPAQAQDAFWQESAADAPFAQTSEFEVQEVGFKRRGFRRKGFNRSGFRRGRFRRSGLRRGVRRRVFKPGLSHRGIHRSSFGRRRFRRSFGHGGVRRFGHSGFRRGRFGHSFGFKRRGFGHSRFGKFGRFRRFGSGKHFSRVKGKSSEHFDHSLDSSKEWIPDSQFLDEFEEQNPEFLEQPLDDPNALDDDFELQASDDLDETRDPGFFEGDSGTLDPDELLTDGIEEPSPEELLGVELELEEVSTSE